MTREEWVKKWAKHAPTLPDEALARALSHFGVRIKQARAIESPSDTSAVILDAAVNDPAAHDHPSSRQPRVAPGMRQ